MRRPLSQENDSNLDVKYSLKNERPMNRALQNLKSKSIVKHAKHIVCCLFILLSVACASLKEREKSMIIDQMGTSISPQQLKSVHGKVAFNYTLQLPPKSIKATQIVKITPIVQYGEKKIILPSCFIQGQGVKHTSFPVVKYRKPFSMTKSYEFKAEDGMENAKIIVLTEWAKCGKSGSIGEFIAYSKGVKMPVIEKTIAEKVQIHQEKKQTTMVKEEFTGIVMFSIGKSTAIASQNYMKDLKSRWNRISTNPEAKITSIQWVTSCSPDGTEFLNKYLGKKRSEMAKNYFEQELHLTHLPEYKEAMSQIISQNWDGLYKLIESSKISNTKELVQKMKSVNTQKRKQLLFVYMNRYPIIKEQFLPSLRNTQMIIKYEQAHVGGL